jgi:hypothetical protein
VAHSQWAEGKWQNVFFGELFGFAAAINALSNSRVSHCGHAPFAKLGFLGLFFWRLESSLYPKFPAMFLRVLTASSPLRDHGDIHIKGSLNPI